MVDFLLQNDDIVLSRIEWNAVLQQMNKNNFFVFMCTEMRDLAEKKRLVKQSFARRMCGWTGTEGNGERRAWLLGLVAK